MKRIDLTTKNQGDSVGEQPPHRDIEIFSSPGARPVSVGAVSALLLSIVAFIASSLLFLFTGEQAHTGGGTILSTIAAPSYLTTPPSTAPSSPSSSRSTFPSGAAMPAIVSTNVPTADSSAGRQNDPSAKPSPGNTRSAHTAEGATAPSASSGGTTGKPSVAGVTTEPAPSSSSEQTTDSPVAETTPPRLFPQLTASDRLLFYGDSVTQAGRDTANPTDLGYGYVADIAATLATDPALSGITVMNRGINGDGIVNLVYRFDRDCLALEPTIVTILIGVNDTMATTDWGNPVSLEQFEAQYRTVLSAIRDQIGARVVLMTPVLTPIDEKQTSWLPDLDARIDIVKRLAGEYGALLVDTNTALDQLAAEIGPWAVAEDGVHPGAQGAAALANAWIDAVAR